MKRLALSLLLCAGLAYADTPAKPEVADEADVLRVQLAESRAENLAVKIEAAKRDLADLQRAAQDARAKLTAKYVLVDGDQVDPVSRVIQRAPKPETKAAVAPAVAPAVAAAKKRVDEAQSKVDAAEAKLRGASPKKDSKKTKAGVSVETPNQTGGITAAEVNNGRPATP